MKNKERIIKELDEFQDKFINYRGWDSVLEVEEFFKETIKKIKELIEKIK